MHTSRTMAPSQDRNHSRWLGMVSLVVFALTVAGAVGCANQPSDGQNQGGSMPTTSAAAAVPVTITRTGGIAGVRQSVEISPDGGWVYTDHRQNTTERGQLTPDQKANLLALTTTPALGQQLSTPASPGNCADTFQYELSVGPVTGRYYAECDTPSRPAVAAVVAAIEQATAL